MRINERKKDRNEWEYFEGYDYDINQDTKYKIFFFVKVRFCIKYKIFKIFPKNICFQIKQIIVNYWNKYINVSKLVIFFINLFSFITNQ